MLFQAELLRTYKSYPTNPSKSINLEAGVILDVYGIASDGLIAYHDLVGYFFKVDFYYLKPLHK